MINIRLATNEDITPLVQSAQKDNHRVVFPSHVVEKSGELVGSLSIGVLPAIFVWMHTEKTTRNDALRAMHFYETNLKERSMNDIILPCSETSPYYKYLLRLGYSRMTSTTLLYKHL